MMEKRRILAVDDNAANLDLIEEILYDKYIVRTACDGAQALRLAAEFQPEIILLDIMMPGMNGYEVCRLIKSEPLLRGAKVILVSAKAMTSERLAGYEAGADDYIVKPFDEQELLAKLRVYLQLKQVEEIDRVKSEVMTLLNHETRTPLNAIIAPLQLMTGEVKPSDADQQELMAIALQSAERLAELLEKALLYSSLRSGHKSLNCEECELGDVVRESLDTLSVRLAGKQIVFTANVRTGVEASVDRSLVKRAIFSLLDNAIKHTPQGGTIGLEVCRNENMAIIRISNSGAGVDQQVLPHIFDAFHTNDIKHHSEGQRLSLALVRQIALEHGGNIEVESVPGEGAKFTLTLPSESVLSPQDALRYPCTAR
jgi:two-component system, sensor histidine kinase and response regulator